MAATATPDEQGDELTPEQRAEQLAGAELATVEDLVTPNLAVERYLLPNGKAVEVRPLSRAEVLHVKTKDFPADQVEHFTLSKAMVTPGMTEAKVRDWFAASPAGELTGLVAFVMRKSGLSTTAPKEAMKTFRE